MKKRLSIGEETFGISSSSAYLLVQGTRSGLGTLAFAWLPGLRRADPSTPLDKAVCGCGAAAAAIEAAAGGIIEQVGGGGETVRAIASNRETRSMDIFGG